MSTRRHSPALGTSGRSILPQQRWWSCIAGSSRIFARARRARHPRYPSRTSVLHGPTCVGIIRYRSNRSIHGLAHRLRRSRNWSSISSGVVSSGTNSQRVAITPHKGWRSPRSLANLARSEVHSSRRQYQPVGFRHVKHNYGLGRYKWGCHVAVTAVRAHSASTLGSGVR